MIPSEITLDPSKQRLTISYDDGAYTYSAQWLRENSPSAEVQGHSPAQKITVTGVENVRIADIEPIGNYAIKLRFDDGHDSGLFSYDYFRKNLDHAERVDG